MIFYSLIKPMVNEKGEKEMDIISISQALQIAGRAGRYVNLFLSRFCIVSSSCPSREKNLATYKL